MSLLKPSRTAYEDAYARIVGGSPQSFSGLLASPGAAENFRNAPSSMQGMRGLIAQRGMPDPAQMQEVQMQDPQAQMQAPQSHQSLLSKLAGVGSRLVHGITGADGFEDPRERRAALKSGLSNFGAARLSLDLDPGQAFAIARESGMAAGQSLQDRNKAAAAKLQLQAARANYLDPSLPMAQRIETAIQKAYDAGDDEAIKHFSDMFRSMQGSATSAADTTKAKAPAIRSVEFGGKKYDVAVDPNTGQEQWRMQTGVVAPKEDKGNEPPKATQAEQQALQLQTRGVQELETVRRLINLPEGGLFSPSFADGLFNSNRITRGMASQEYKDLSAAMTRAGRAALRKESGAALSASEEEQMRKDYVIGAGDTEGDVRRKLGNLERDVPGISSGVSPRLTNTIPGAARPAAPRATSAGDFF